MYPQYTPSWFENQSNAAPPGRLPLSQWTHWVHPLSLGTSPVSQPQQGHHKCPLAWETTCYLSPGEVTPKSADPMHTPLDLSTSWLSSPNKAMPPPPQTHKLLQSRPLRHSQAWLMLIIAEKKSSHLLHNCIIKKPKIMHDTQQAPKNSSAREVFPYESYSIKLEKVNVLDTTKGTQ